MSVLASYRKSDFEKWPLRRARAPIRLRNIGCDAGCLAGLNVFDLAVTAIGHRINLLDSEALASRDYRLRQQAEVRDLAVNLLLGDQVMLGVHRDLSVVAHSHADASLHRP